MSGEGSETATKPALGSFRIFLREYRTRIDRRYLRFSIDVRGEETPAGDGRTLRPREVIVPGQKRETAEQQEAPGGRRGPP
jgi:hypothetical protein